MATEDIQYWPNEPFYDAFTLQSLVFISLALNEKIPEKFTLCVPQKNKSHTHGT